MSVATAAVAVGVLGGCAKPTWEERQREAAKDPLIQLLMRDPMYAWNPVTPATRAEVFFPKEKDKNFKPSAYASVSVSFTPEAGPEGREVIEAEIRAAVERLGYPRAAGGWEHQLEGITIHVVVGGQSDLRMPDRSVVLETMGRP